MQKKYGHSILQNDSGVFKKEIVLETLLQTLARESIEELKCTFGDVFDQGKWPAGLS